MPIASRNGGLRSGYAWASTWGTLNPRSSRIIIIPKGIFGTVSTIVTDSH